MKSYDEWKLSNQWDDDPQDEDREEREDAELLINELKREDGEQFSRETTLLQEEERRRSSGV